MKAQVLKQALLSAFLMMAAAANAGDFTNIPFTSPNATVVEGANNQSADQLYLDATVGTWLVDGDEDYTNKIAQTINYNYAGGSATLTLLNYNETDDFEIGGHEAGDFFDMVYRDSRDNKLVFGMRVEMEAEEEGEDDLNVAMDDDEEEVELELNFLYRTGFNGYQTAAAWTFITDNDLRMYNAALTSSTLLDGPFASDAGTVRVQSDLSAEEGNPFSGLYLIKTDATDYVLAANGIGYFQAGEEGQMPTGAYIQGFIAAVPEPETYAMFLAGLGLMGAVARRRQQK